MSAPDVTPLFVYGTLKRGGGNHEQLRGQRFVGPARTGPGLTLYSLGDYPGMVRAPADPAGVEGELWEVDGACLARLDRFEGVPEGLYQRVRIPLRPPHQDVVAETYLYAGSVTGRASLGSQWPPGASRMP